LGTISLPVNAKMKSSCLAGGGICYQADTLPAGEAGFWRSKSRAGFRDAEISHTTMGPQQSSWSRAVDSAGTRVWQTWLFAAQ
jgi:hypothetical protein